MKKRIWTAAGAVGVLGLAAISGTAVAQAQSLDIAGEVTSERGVQVKAAEYSPAALDSATTSVSAPTPSAPAPAQVVSAASAPPPEPVAVPSAVSVQSAPTVPSAASVASPVSATSAD